MPDEPPPTPAAPAAPAPATPPAATPPAPPVDDKAQHKDVPTLMKLLMDTVPEEDEEEKKKEKDKKKEEPPATPPAPAPAPADDGKPIRKRVAPVKRPELPVVEPRQPAPAPAPAPAASAAEAKKWEEGLEEDEKEMLEDARSAERTFGERRKGLVAQVEKFIKDHKAMVSQPDFDPDSPEYKAFVEGGPKLSRTEIREIEQARITEKVRGESDAKYQDMQHKIYVRDEEPRVTAAAQQVFNELANTSLPDEIANAIKEAGGGQAGYAKVAPLYQLELETAQEVLAAATDDIKEFLRISRVDPETKRPLQPVATDPSDPKYVQHQRLGQIVGDLCENFKNTAGEAAIRNGRWFVTRDEWNRIRPDQRNRFWTFTNAEIIDIAKKQVKGAVENAINNKRKYVEQRGWIKKPAAPAAPAPAGDRPATPPAPPRPAAAPPGGGGDTPPTEGAKMAAVLNQG